MIHMDLNSNDCLPDFIFVNGEKINAHKSKYGFSHTEHIDYVTYCYEDDDVTASLMVYYNIREIAYYVHSKRVDKQVHENEVFHKTSQNLYAMASLMGHAIDTLVRDPRYWK